MPYFNWEALKNHRAQYAVIEVEDGELVNILFRTGTISKLNRKA